MRSKALVFLMMILTVPTLASAYTYWSVATSSQPAISGAVTAPAGPGYSTTGSTTSVTSSTVTSADFLVNPAPAGYALSYVSIDGVTSAPLSGSTYRVSKGTRVNHTLTAVYTPKKFTISTSKTGNGIIDPTVQVSQGSNKTITMTAGTGCRISSVVAANAVQTGGDGISFAAYTFSNIQADQSVSVVFSVTPVLACRIATQTQNIVLGNPLTIDAGTSSYTETTSFAWSVTPAGATLVPAADGKTAILTANALGNYQVNLTLSAPGLPSSSANLAIGAVTQSVYDSSVCAACHLSRNPTFVADYLASRHAGTPTVSCQRCHNPTGTLSHTYRR